MKYMIMLYGSQQDYDVLTGKPTDKPPMSAEDVAVVEGAYEAFARGGTDEFLEHWTDDLDHRSIEGAPDDRGPIHGL